MAAEGGHFDKKNFFFMDVLLRRQSEFDWRQIRTVLDTPAGRCAAGGEAAGAVG